MSIYKDYKRETPKFVNPFFERIGGFKYEKPIGVIGEVVFKASWGCDGSTYYVTCGFWGQKITNMVLELEEAKALCNAYSFCDFPQLPLSNKGVNKVIKQARKQYRLHDGTTELAENDKMFWAFVDYFSNPV